MSEKPRVTFSVTRSADVTWTGPIATGAGVIDVPSGVMSGAAITFPSRTGEPDGHTSPEELIASAHAGCFAMSLAGALGAQETEYVSLTVRANLTLGRVEGVMQFTEANLEVVVRGTTLTDAEASAVVEVADSRCPVSQALRATMPVVFETWVEAGVTP